MRAMGANLTFQAARRAAKCLGIVNVILDNLTDEKSGEHARTNTEDDVSNMAKLLIENTVFQHVPGR